MNGADRPNWGILGKNWPYLRKAGAMKINWPLLLIMPECMKLGHGAWPMTSQGPPTGAQEGIPWEGHGGVSPTCRSQNHR